MFHIQLIENKIDTYLYIFEAQVKQYLEVKKDSFTGLDLKRMMVWINVFIFYLKKWESKIKMKRSEKKEKSTREKILRKINWKEKTEN